MRVARAQLLSLLFFCNAVAPSEVIAQTVPSFHVDHPSSSEPSRTRRGIERRTPANEARGVLFGYPIDPAWPTWCSGTMYWGSQAPLTISIQIFDPNHNLIGSDSTQQTSHYITHTAYADATLTGTYRCEVRFYAWGEYVGQDSGTWDILFSDYSLTINTFIPMPHAPAPPWDLTYGGDHRGYDINGSFRTNTALTFHHPRVAGNGYTVGPFYNTGITYEYNRSSSELPSNPYYLKPEALADTILHDHYLKHRQAQASTAGLSCSYSRQSSSQATVQCKASMNNPLFDWGSFNDVDYELRLHLTWNDPDPPSGAGPSFVLEGCHDGFPAYEMYVDFIPIYLFNGPQDHGQTVFSLLPPCEWSVNTSGSIP